MMPFGNHKGFGLGVVAETLTSMLSGSMFHTLPEGASAAVNFADFATSHFFMAIDIGVFEDLDIYRGKVDQYIEYLHGLPVKAGAGGVVYPGELEARFEAQSEKEGLKISEKVLDDMLAAASAQGLDVSSYVFPKINQGISGAN